MATTGVPAGSISDRSTTAHDDTGPTRPAVGGTSVEVAVRPGPVPGCVREPRQSIRYSVDHTSKRGRTRQETSVEQRTARWRADLSCAAGLAVDRIEATGRSCRRPGLRPSIASPIRRFSPGRVEAHPECVPCVFWGRDRGNLHRSGPLLDHDLFSPIGDPCLRGRGSRTMAWWSARRRRWSRAKSVSATVGHAHRGEAHLCPPESVTSRMSSPMAMSPSRNARMAVVSRMTWMSVAGSVTRSPGWCCRAGRAGHAVARCRRG